MARDYDAAIRQNEEKFQQMRKSIEGQKNQLVAGIRKLDRQLDLIDNTQFVVSRGFFRAEDNFHGKLPFRLYDAQGDLRIKHGNFILDCEQKLADSRRNLEKLNDDLSGAQISYSSMDASLREEKNLKPGSIKRWS